MLTVLGGLAEFERHLILTRTAEGRTGAQANGVRLGVSQRSHHFNALKLCADEPLVRR